MKHEITVNVAAAMAEVTPKTIREWIRDDGLPLVAGGRKGPGRGARIDGIEFVRWLVARRCAAPGTLDLDQERARLAKWQADRTHQDVEIRAGKLLVSDDVQQWVAAMIATAKARLLQIPDTLRSLLPHDHAATAADEARRVVHEALADLAATGQHPPRG